MSEVPRPLLTVAEVAEFCHLSKGWVHGMIRSGELPAFKLGRSLRIDCDVFKAFLDARRLEVRPKNDEWIDLDAIRERILRRHAAHR